MNTSCDIDIAAHERTGIDYGRVRRIIETIAKSIDNNALEGIMDVAIRAADNDDAAISMAMVMVPELDILAIINPDSKYAKPVYYFRSEHGAELDNESRYHLILEAGYLLGQYVMERSEEYAPGIVFNIGDKDRAYFKILCVINYDDGDAYEVEFGDRAENVLLALNKSISSILASISDESLKVTHWGTFDGIPLVECVRK